LRILHLMLNHQKSDISKVFYCNLFTGKTRLFLVVLFLIVAKSPVSGQNDSGTGLFKRDTAGYHSAKKATYYSMMLPGLGQAYNKKYWKIPIIYAGFGTLGYFIGFNGKEYRNFRNAYNIVATGDTANYSNSYVLRYNGNLDQLREGRNYYRRNLEFNYILAALLYILNIVDASVDGNLYNFDVSDDISIKFEPMRNSLVYLPEPQMGITLRYRF